MRKEDYPDKCPITGLPFFMVITHPDLGDVPTYGGPYDSYTIPELDEDGDFLRERFDHDEGCWWDGTESIGNATEIIENLRDKLAAAEETIGCLNHCCDDEQDNRKTAEKQRDEARAQVVVMAQAIADALHHLEYGDTWTTDNLKQALQTTPAAALDKVNGMVKALEEIAYETHPYISGPVPCSAAIAENALKKWKGGADND